MGLFSSSTPSPALPAPKISSDGAPIAPDRTQRAKCWEARDGYFRCLDKNNIVDSLTEHDKAEKGCAKEGREFEGNCASSWVTYFKKRRVMEYQKNQTLEKLRKEGAQEMPGGIGAGAPGQRP
ncbi:cytochrome oxidase c subunit VIb-domain-containing protein [Halenospora varia]|nr:cytochrome oxidase c subunit VIb-domain-containing protein [Halenospora varia]